MKVLTAVISSLLITTPSLVGRNLKSNVAMSDAPGPPFAE